MIKIRLISALVATGLSLAGCGSSPSFVQYIELRSGDFGVAELATVIAVDPINLQQNIIRFDLSFGEFAVSLLRQNSETASDIWGETVRLFGSAFAAELEDYILGLACVYTVSPQGTFISDAVAGVVRFTDIEDDIGTVISGSGVPFDEADSVETAQTSERQSTESSRDAERQDPVDVSVVSNCLVDVYPDDEVRLVQTSSRMIILPQ